MSIGNNRRIIIHSYSFHIGSDRALRSMIWTANEIDIENLPRSSSWPFNYNNLMSIRISNRDDFLGSSSWPFNHDNLMSIRISNRDFLRSSSWPFNISDHDILRRTQMCKFQTKLHHFFRCNNHTENTYIIIDSGSTSRLSLDDPFFFLLLDRQRGRCDETRK